MVGPKRSIEVRCVRGQKAQEIENRVAQPPVAMGSFEPTTQNTGEGAGAT